MKLTINNFVTILLVCIIFALLVGTSSAAWCDSDYTKRINVSVNNTAGSALTDYQVYVNLSSNPINETSLRVYNSSDCTSRDFWCEHITSGNCTKLWINYSGIAASTWTNNTAIYYDNIAASSASNGTSTFEFFDDFSSPPAIWTRQGNCLSSTSSEPSVIYEGNPQILTGESNVFKMWYGYGWNNPHIYYAESTDGLSWTQYSGNPVISDVYYRPSVFKNASTYYLFVSNGDTSIKRFHSTNGTHWTDDGTVLNLGAGGQWDDTSMSNTYVWIENTTDWKMMYDAKGTGSGGKWYAGLATSTDGTTWTKSGSNPVITTYGGGAGHVEKIGSYYYLWTWGGVSGCSLPCDIYRHRSTNLTTWEVYPTNSTFPRATTDEGEGTSVGQVADETLIEHNGQVYMWYAASADGGQESGNYHIKLAIANMTFAELVATDEMAETGSLDENKWLLLQSSGISLSGGVATLYKNSVPHTAILSKTYQINDGIIETRVRSTLSSYIGTFIWFRRENQTECNYSRIWGQGAGSHDWSGYQHMIIVNNTIEANTVTTVGTNWHYYRLIANGVSLTFKRFADGSFDTEQATVSYTDPGGLTSGYIGFEPWNTDNKQEIDWVRVRKYTSTEPSATLGSEEQQGGNPTLHIGNAINIKEDWSRNFNSNLSANVTTANASGVLMNFSNTEFGNSSLGNLNLTLDEWINESHNVNAPVTNVSVNVYLNSTTSGATNDTDSFWYEITKRSNTATMDSAATQNVDTSETFYVNATCNEEYGDTFLGAANLLEDGAIIDTDTSVTDYVNFSHSESSVGQYNYTVRFYNLTHYNNATTPTYSNVTVFDVMYEPPDPTALANTTGNFWVNHTWSAGSGGNVTDSFNVSVFPGWYNTTVNSYYNDSGLTPHDWSNITVYAFNSSGNGSLSTGSVSDDVQIPNNAVTLTVTQNYNKLETETVFISDTASSDTDGDTPAYSCNRTDLFVDFSTVTGYGNWTTLITDAGTYYIDIGVSDGWGSTDNKTLTITITDATPTTPTNLQNTTGNFWVNHTWSGGANTNSFNVSVNLSWTNGSSNEYHNNTPLSAHKWSNVSVYGFNSTSRELSSGISQDTQIPNNVPVLTGLPDNTTDEDVNQTDIFDLDDYFNDADGDTPTYLVESNNQSAYVSVTINASNNVSYTLASGWNGTASVVINATDGWGGEDTDTFLIIVNAAPLPGDYTPDDPTNLQNTTGNYWVNYTWDVGGGNVTDSYNVSWNLTWYNGTTDTFMKKEVGASNWANITVYAYNNSGNGSLSAGSVSDEVQAPAFVPCDYVPPDPTTLQNTTGNYYVNYTWVMGVPGNITDSYNVSWNLSWFNGTLTTYMQKEVGASNWGNITVYAYNSSGNGTLSSGSLSDNVQAPAYVPGDYIPTDPTTLANTTGNYWVNYTWSDGGGANITDSYNVSWNLTWFNNTLTTYMQKDVGVSGWANITIYAFNSSGNGSLSTGYISDEVQAPSAPIGDYVPPNPINLVNSSGNGWVDYTWSADTGNITDSYNVSWNLTWYNTTLVAHMNDTVGEFGWANITVFAFNSSGNGSLSAGSISSDTQSGGGTYTTSMTTGVYNLITYYGESNSTAEQFGLDIGNVEYIARYNNATVPFTTHTMGHIDNNFTTIHGWSYFVFVHATGSTTYNRNNIPDSPYDTSLLQKWNTIGWTNSTDTNAEGVASSVGSACKYTSMLNADGWSYTTHTVGFTSNNHAVDKGKGYWVWVNTGVNWGRNS